MGEQVDLEAVRRQMEFVRVTESYAWLLAEVRAARSVIGAAKVFVDTVAEEPNFRYPLGAELLRQAITSYERTMGRGE